MNVKEHIFVHSKALMSGSRHSCLFELRLVEMEAKISCGKKTLETRWVKINLFSRVTSNKYANLVL